MCMIYYISFLLHKKHSMKLEQFMKFLNCFRIFIISKFCITSYAFSQAFFIATSTLHFFSYILILVLEKSMHLLFVKENKTFLIKLSGIKISQYITLQFSNTFST